MREAYLIYDGDCPFCSQYVRFTRLQQSVGPVAMIDAREGGAEVEEAIGRGYRLDEGMVLKLDGQFYYGADCIHRLALLSTRSNLVNSLCRSVFRNPKRAGFLYPWMKSGRRLALSLLGKKPLGY